VLQIGVNSILTVDTFVGMFMPAYLILEAGKVGNFNLRDREENNKVERLEGPQMMAASETV